AGLALLARFEAPAARLRFDAGLGAAAVLVAFQGHANTPLASSSETVVTGAGYLRADLTLEATGWLHLGVRGVGGLAGRAAPGRCAGTEVASWGRAFGAALGFFEICWQ